MTVVIDPKDVSHRRRCSGWRERVIGDVGQISKEVAKGLTTHFKNGNEVREGFSALRELDESERLKIWHAAFPGLVDVMEICWNSLDPHTIARRDGGTSGNGEPFSWKLTESEQNHFRMEWLRKLLIAVGPFPELDFSDVVANMGVIASGRNEDSEGDFFKETTGHFYDTDAPAYAASALLSTQPDSELAESITNILESQLFGQIDPAQTVPVRPVFTAWLCADRPDLWSRVDDHFSKAGQEAGLRERLLYSRMGVKPGAWVNFLMTIRDFDLMRFEAVRDAVRNWFGVEWQWKSNRRDDLEGWLVRWIEMQESKSCRSNAFCENDAGDFALALWGEAVHDADRTLERISNPEALQSNQRVGAAEFLKACPPKRCSAVALEYALCSDLRASAVGAEIVHGYTLPSSSEFPDMFERVSEFIEELPDETSSVLKFPDPFRDRKPDYSGLRNILVNRFPDGAEARIERLLPKLSVEERNNVVTRLNRYRLDQADREIAEIMHGGDPVEWQQWLDDHEGDQLLAQRHLLFKMINDRSLEVAEHAYKAVKKFCLSQHEFNLVRPALLSNSAKKRLFIIELLANQSDQFGREIIPAMLKSTKANERSAALEVIRIWAEHDTDKELVESFRPLLTSYSPKSKAETRSFSLLQNVLDSKKGSEKSREADSSPAAFGVENAFGLVDPDEIKKPDACRDRQVDLNSDTTDEIIKFLDQWLTENANTRIPNPHPWRKDSPAQVPLAEARPPYVSPNLSIAENLEKFPLASQLSDWWKDRPASMRDNDGYELFRVKLAVSFAANDRSELPSVVLKELYGLDRNLKLSNRKHDIEHLVDWIDFITEWKTQQPGWRKYLIDATESAYARLPEKQKNYAFHWFSLIEKHLLSQDETPDDLLNRLWTLGRNKHNALHRTFCYQIHEVAYFFKRGISTEPEVIWHLVGDRKLKDRYDRDRAFNDLATVTRPRPPLPGSMHGEAFQEIVKKISERLVELELNRGEEPVPCSFAIRSIHSLRGSQQLIRILCQFGDIKLTRPRQLGYGEEDYTRKANLIHLLGVCRPEREDTPKQFAELCKNADIPAKRLLEVAMFRPVWAKFVEAAVEADGLQEAVAWIFAHTRSSEYAWEENSKEVWQGETNRISPIPPEEFIEGAIDLEWFDRAFAKVGAKTWSQLYKAAKFASPGKGHMRARLVSDARLGKVTDRGLKKRLKEKGDLNAAIALAAVPLPKQKRARNVQLKERYENLASLSKKAKKSKPQRRASEESAFRVGVKNLARAGGYGDTVRFEWAMEMATAEDLAREDLQLSVEGVDFEIEVKPDGNLHLGIRREGKTLKTVPQPLRKNPQVVAFRKMLDGFKEQAQRIRPALEQMMSKGTLLSPREWKDLLHHPLAGPQIERLVLISDKKLRGFPRSRENRFERPDDERAPWPEEGHSLRIAHPLDFSTSGNWQEWQRHLFNQKISQPFKQIFRELYVPTKNELASEVCFTSRYEKLQINTRQAFAILAGRGWVWNPEHGLVRVYHSARIAATLHFEEHFYSPHQQESATISFSENKKRNPKPVTVIDVPGRIFSETMRDIDLIVSVANATGADPEITSRSTLETRAALVRETCQLLNLKNVKIEKAHALISGKRGDYRIHLNSGQVHQSPGSNIPLHTDLETERGRIFLPFADDDPVSIDVLTRVLYFANDSKIRDPEILRHLNKK